MTTSQQPIPVVYISGMGHSGSTLLDMLIGTAPEVRSVGEFAFYSFYHDAIQESHVERTFICVCKKEFNSCPFWQEVHGSDSLQIKRTYSLRENIEITLRSILPGAIPRSPIDDDTYTAFERILHASTDKKPKVRFVLDSSKDPRRLYRLLQDDRFEVFPIFLVRDARAVGHSYSKKERKTKYNMKRKSYPLTVLRWIIVNMTTQRLLRKHGRGLHISYEAFTQDPVKTIQRINSALDSSISETRYIEDIRNESYHTVDGSYIKFKPIERIYPNQKWRKSIPRIQRLLWDLWIAPWNAVWVYKNS